jgi:hypothetical protein
MKEGETGPAGSERAGRTLWVLHKDGRSLTCLVSGEPGHEELRVLVDGEVYLDETHTVHDGAVSRARTLLHGFQAHGWTPVFVELPHA